MNEEFSTHVFGPTIILFLGTLLFTTPIAPTATSREGRPQIDSSFPFIGPSTFFRSKVTDDQSTRKGSIAIPPGTILPVHLNSTISSAKSKPGQEITGRIMQDVPLATGARVREGSKVVGHIVEVAPATTGAEARVSLQFDKLISSDQTISITTNLRAIAGFMEVRDAQTPFGAGESNDNQWLATVQVGGEVAYGEGGPVTSGENANIVVGKLVKGSLLGRVRAKEGGKCRGAIDGNDRPQALWVFSSDACGVYGLEHVGIRHAGRTDPIGVIVLASERGNLKIHSGAGMLLRVIENGRN